MKKILWILSALLAVCTMGACGVKNDVESNSGLQSDIENSTTTEKGEDGDSDSILDDSTSSDSTLNNESSDWEDIEFPRP